MSLFARATAERARTIGLLSDTHGPLRPEAMQALHGCEPLLHAGDIGSPEVLSALRRLGDVHAVRGNNDHGAWAEALPEVLTLTFDSLRVLVLHDRNDLARLAPHHGCQVVVSGHSHRPLVETCDGVLFVNPGSCGPRRFRLPVSVARLDLRAGRAHATLVTLAV